MSSQPLVKVAIFGAFASVSGCVVLYYLMQRKLASSGYYTETVKALRDNERAVTLIGEPLRFQFLRLNDKRNHITTTQAEVAIPVSGSKHAGHIHSFADHHDGKWRLQKVIFEFKGRPDKMVILDTSSNNKS
ncbi:PREDICTED: uncharacterized protein LOC105316950 [Amphimedon queenslandica]|uniref:Cytochrome c oxidase assembly factor 1 homolog n=1 Tax=Amphimedon queenslandica TaxID=400682 RepID=A0A1X7VEL5_AMPQE|nr:PREDICTED: uncharacterized protein LOC105316950 [Amphimedon queenslandica]|eukprot:XP_011410577.1 PREDICTED: uncharacterized protein LOC105316950 [Amphimedon queenslandica]